MLETVESAKKVAKVSPLQTRETWEQKLGLSIDDEQQDTSSVCGTVYKELIILTIDCRKYTPVLGASDA